MELYSPKASLRNPRGPFSLNFNTYAQSRFDKRSEKTNKKALQAAHQQIVGYYLRSTAACLPRARRKQVSDVHPFLEAFWHYIQAGQWQEAYTLLEQEQLFTHLHGWGDNVTLLELYQLLFPLDKWNSDSLPLTHISGEIGQIYSALGQPPQALEYHKQALQTAREENFQREQAEALYHLGTVYDDLGNKMQAQQYYEQTLLRYEDVEDGGGRRQALSKLAWVSIYQGEKDRAQQYGERALLLCREAGDRRGEAAALQTMGWIYHEDIKQAQDYEKQALHIFRELKDRDGEAWTLANLGVLCDVFFEKKQYHNKALELFKEAGDQRGEAWTLYNLGDLYSLESSSSNQKEQANKYLMQALDLFRNVEDRTGEGAVLQKLGSVYFSLGRKGQALECLRRALNIFNVSEDLPWKVRLLQTITDYSIEYHCFDVALASLLLARECFEKLQRDRGRNEIQEQIDAFCREVGEQQFALLLTQVEAQALQVVEQGLSSLSPEKPL